MRIEDYVRILHGDMSAQYEIHIADYINKLPASSIFYDLGACRGLFSLYAASRGLNVYAFEVDKHNYTEFIENLSYNPELSSKIRIFNIGIADSGPKEVDLYYNKHLAGIHHKSLDVDNFTGDKSILRGDNFYTTKVTVNSLDNIIEQTGISWPEHIKVDIDGSEYMFIEGAHKALTKARSIIIEIYKGNEIYKDVINKLLSFEFKVIEEHSIAQPGMQLYFNLELSK